jgi:AraC-like DNA-binding protein
LQLIPVSIMEYIILSGVFEALFLAFLLFFKKGKTLSDKLLSIIFLLYAINILLSYIEVYNRSHNFPFPLFINTSVPLIILHGPALWFYIKSQTEQNFHFRNIYFLHFIPFTLLLIDQFVEVFILPDSEKITMVNNDLFRSFFTYKFFVILMAVSTISYFVWSLILIKKYQMRIKTYFSQIKKIDLQWLKTLLIAALISYSLIYIMYIADILYQFTPPGLLHAISFSIGSVYILFLGFYGHRQGNLFSSFPVNLDLNNAIIEIKAEKPLLKEEEIFINDLFNFMKTNKPYLNSELTIALLANDLNVTSEYLSGILNGQLNNNFFDFINHYRIEEFKIRCKDPVNNKLTLMGIAYDSGFNSKATFNRVFKKATGLTPGNYKNQT